MTWVQDQYRLPALEVLIADWKLLGMLNEYIACPGHADHM